MHAEPFFFQCKQEKEEICAILPTYSYCKQITPQEFEEQKVSTSQAAVAELLENIIKDKNLSVKDKKKKLKQVSYFIFFCSAFVREGRAQAPEPGAGEEQNVLRNVCAQELLVFKQWAKTSTKLFCWSSCSHSVIPDGIAAWIPVLHCPAESPLTCHRRG